MIPSPTTLILISFLAVNNLKAAALVSAPYPTTALQPAYCLFQEINPSTNQPVPKGLYVKAPVQKLSNGSVRCYWNMTKLPEFTKKFAVKAMTDTQVSKPTTLFLSRFWSSGIYLHYTQQPTWSQQ